MKVKARDGSTLWEPGEEPYEEDAMMTIGREELRRQDLSILKGMFAILWMIFCPIAMCAYQAWSAS